MDKQQRSEYRRLKAVQLHCKQYEEVFEDNPAMTDITTVIDELIKGLNNVLQKQKRGSKPTTALKNQKELDIVRSLRKVNGLLQMVAISEGRDDLKVLARNSRSKLLKMPGEDLAGYASVILSEVNTYSDQMYSLGYTYEKQDAFAVQVEEFGDWVAAPRNVIAARSSATQDVLPALLANARDLIHNRLNGLMEDYELSHPEFYLGYLHARILVDPGYKKRLSDLTKTSAPSAETVEDDGATEEESGEDGEG